MRVFDDKELKNKKSQKNFNFILLSCGFTVVILIASLITLIMLDVYEFNKNIDDDCLNSHEDYDINTNESFLGVYNKFAIACDNVYCSSVGKQIFEKNGSIIDVAIATGLCNGIMNAQSMGIGGGHFFNIYFKAENKSYMINGRDTAPINSDENMFTSDPNLSIKGGLAVAIPGELRGYYEAYKRWGVLKWSELFEPSIKLCQDGFPVSSILASAIKSSEANIRKDEELKSIFINPKTNEIFKMNDIVRMPKLAETLRVISKSGSDVEFYNGSLTESIVKEINEKGGIVQLDDFKQYNIKSESDRFVIKLDENNRIYSFPSPSSGPLIPYIMRIMKGFDLGKLKEMTENDQKTFYHRLAETFKHAYAKRSTFGDEDFIDMQKIYEDLNNETYINSIRNMINDKKTFPSKYYGGAFFKEDKGTAHISIIGPNGDAVALTSTINGYFGAKFAGKYTGIIWNNGMDDFSSPGISNSYGYIPSVENYIKPKKRPVSSMSPSIIVDNDNNVKLILGASGGSKIISSIAQVTKVLSSI